MPHELVDVRTANDWRAYHDLRRRILWEARGMSGYDPDHPDDRVAGHHPMLLLREGRPIGAIRLDECGDGIGIVRAVVIDDGLQGHGHGRALMVLAEARVRALRLDRLHLHSDVTAVGFYERLGWLPAAPRPAFPAASPDGALMTKDVARGPAGKAA